MNNRTRRRPRRGRKHSPALLLLVGALALALVIALLVVNWVFTVRRLTVTGSGDISAQTVARMSGITLGTRMRSVDVERVRSGVENDGRLAFVSLERRYPGGLLLTVRKRTMDALAMQAGKVLALDADGYVVSVLTQLPAETLPYVSGLKPGHYAVGRRLDATDGRVPAMTEVLNALKRAGATALVSELSLADPENLRIITRGGTTVLLGNADNMINKITWMAGAVADITARGEGGGQLDVSSGTKGDYKPGVSPVPTDTPIPEDIIVRRGNDYPGAGSPAGDATPEPTPEPVIGPDG